MKTLIRMDSTGDTPMTSENFSEAELKATFDEHVGRTVSTASPVPARSTSLGPMVPSTAARHRRSRLRINIWPRSCCLRLILPRFCQC